MMMRVMRHLCPPGILRLAKCADDELQKTFSIDTFYSRIHPSCTIVMKAANVVQATSTFLFSCCHFTECRICVVHEVLAHCHGVRSFTGYGEDVSVIRKLRTCQKQIGLNCQVSRTVSVTQMQNSARPPRGWKVFLPPSRCDLRESQQKGELP